MRWFAAAAAFRFRRVGDCAMSAVGCATCWLLLAACASSPPTATPAAAQAGDTSDTKATVDAAPERPPTPTCTDGQANGAETDVDCGGACVGCGLGKACVAPSDCASGVCSSGHCSVKGALLGSGGTVKWTPVVAEKLNKPADLAFNPQAPDELWITSQSDDALVLVQGVGKPAQQVSKFVDGSAHFLEEVVTIAFSDSGTFGTCGDTANAYNGKKKPNDFMGPVMWPSDASKFFLWGPDAADVHLDMLHNTSNCMGIAGAGSNRFFVFNGKVGRIDAYDFLKPHPHGTDNHADGTKRRYDDVPVKRVPGVLSDLAYDAKHDWLYIADSGHALVVRITPGTAQVSKAVPTYPNEQHLAIVLGAEYAVAAHPVASLAQPSGLLLHDGWLYVSDHATGLLHAFDAATGEWVNHVDSGLGNGSVAGMDVGPDGRLYVVDRKGQRVLRLEP